MSPDRADDLIQIHLLDILPLWADFVLSVILLLLAVEIGYRFSQVMQRKWPDRAEANVGALSGATLALLAFLLAFVTSTAVGSVSDRRLSVVSESNAIGTTYLRAGYLPEPYSTEARQLLREYLDQRLLALDRDRIAQAITRSEEIHNELWEDAEVLAKEASSPMLALYIASLNEVIDLHTERINVELVARVPWTIITGLFGIAMLALTMVGLHAGYAEKRNLVVLFAFVLTVSIVFLLIVDLTRSQAGLLQVSYQSMMDLQRQLNLSP